MRRPRRSRRLEPARSRSSDTTSFEESFRVLRSNLSVALADLDKPTVIITSATANEGKTLTCTNLAVSFAQAGQRVVVVDLDLRHPSAHQVLRTHNEYGVTDVLLGRRSLEDCLQFVEFPTRGAHGRGGLYFLATGPDVTNPTELLGMGRTARMLDGLARQADIVLLDTPPVLPVADTLVIGRMAAGAVLVTETRRTAVQAITKSKDLLIRNQTRILGVVLNKFQERDANVGYGYGYGYGSGYGPTLPGAGLDEPALSVEALDFEDAAQNGNGRVSHQ